MTKKTIIKGIGIVLGIIVIGFFTLLGYRFYLKTQKFIPSKNKFTKRVAYIDIKKAERSEGFRTCDSTQYIVDYYNSRRGDKVHRVTTYIKGKNGLRNDVMTKYKNDNYTDSGYLNFRFIVNCEGKAGAYVIHENDLNLKPKKFNPNLVEQLFNITLELKEWQPNFMDGQTRDSYMYISYRIENGEIIEIIP